MSIFPGCVEVCGDPMDEGRSGTGGGRDAPVRAAVALADPALQVEMQPLPQKVERKRIIRSDASRLRAPLALKLSDKFGGTEYTDSIDGLTADWATITPPDQALDAGREVALVGAGIRSRQTALANLRDPDPPTELARVLQ